MADNQITTKEWFKNTGKSMGNITRNMLTGIMPATVTSASSTREALRDAKQFGSHYAQISRTQLSQIDRSVAGKKAKAIFDSAMTDLKNGTFGIDKSMDDMFNEWDDDISGDFDMGSFEEEAEVSSDEIIMTSSQGVAKSVMRAGAAQLEGMQQMTKAIIGSNLKSNQAASQQTVNAIMYMGDAINRNLLSINGTLGTINQNLSALIDFQNDNVAPTNQAIVTYLEESAVMMNDLGKMLKSYEQSREGKRTEHRTFDVAGGFDFSDYKSFVKKNFNNNAYTSMIMIMKDLAGMDTENPVGKAIGSVIEAAMPKLMKETMKSFDKNIHSYIQEALFKLGDMQYDSNPIKQILGDIFGAKRQTNNSIRMGSFQKEAIPWNGIAQKYLTEVIPELLTSIDSKMPVSKKYDSGTRRYYDESTGQFITRADLQKKDREEVEGYLAMSFMDPMNELMDQLKINGASSDTQSKAIEQLSKIINDRASERSTIKKSRDDMTDVLSELGLNSTQFRNAVNGMEEAMREFTRMMTERNDIISTSSSVYRNLNNTRGDNAWSRYDSMNPFKYFFGGTGEYNWESEIESILYSGDRDPSLAKDRDLVKRYIEAKSKGRSYEDLRRMVLTYSAQKNVKDQAKGVFDKLKSKFIKDNAAQRGQRAKDLLDTIDNRAFEMVYGMHRREAQTTAMPSGSGESSDDGPAPRQGQTDKRSTSGVGAASSFYTDRMGVKAGAKAGNAGTGRKLHSQPVAFGSVNGWREASNKISRMTDRILKTDTNTILNQTDEEIGAKDEIIMGELKNQMEEAPDTTVEGSIAQMNNTTRTGFLAILNSFQNMSSGFFGKDGFIKKFFSSDGFKNIVADIKEKLIGENGTFSEQWKKVKARAKDLLGKTKGHISNGYDWVYRNTMTHLLGDDYEKTDAYKNYLSAIDIKKKAKKAEETIEDATEKIEFAVKPPEEHKDDQALDSVFEAADKLADDITESGKATVEATLGDPDEAPEKKKKSFWSKFKSMLPKGIAGAIVGAGAVALTGGSLGLLGSMFLPGSIVGGAIVGLGTTILSQTEAFKSVMFGKMNDDGKREGGLISEEMQKSFKKALPTMVGGATLGLLKNIITGGNGIFSNGPLGVITGALLPGGPIGGALIGMGIGLLKNNDTIKDKLFGEKGEDGKRTNGILSNAYNKLSGIIKNNAPALKKGAAGAAIGALTGLTLSNMGFIPAMFSLGGPVGGAIGGLAIGIASSTKKFNEWIFGSEELDENGNPTGKRNKDGLLGRVSNLLMVHVFEPIGDTAKKVALNISDHVKDAIAIPFRLAFGPIVDGLRGVKDNITDVVSDTFTHIGNGLIDVVKTTMRTLFTPVTNLIRKAAGGIGTLVEGGIKMATLPITMPLKILQFATMGKRRGEYMDFYKNYFGNLGGVLEAKWSSEGAGFFGKAKDVFGAIFGADNEIKDAAREGWNNTKTAQGQNALNWRGAAKDRRKLHEERKERRKEEKMWNDANALRRQLSKEWGGRQFDLQDTEVAELRKKFAKIGLDEKQLQTSDDIMDLVYRRGAWKKKGSDRQEGIVIAKSREDKAHEDKMDKGVDYLEEIRDMFRDIAFQQDHKDWDTKTRQQQTVAMRRLKKYGKKYGIDLDPFYVMGDADRIEASHLSDSEWNEYRASTFYQSGDYKGWLSSRKTKKEEKEKDDRSAIATAMYEAMKRSADAAEAANIIATGGVSTGEINENAKASGGTRKKFFDKFHISQNESLQNLKTGFGSVMDSIFKRKAKKDKKDARDERETKEQAHAEALGNPVETVDITNDSQYIIDYGKGTNQAPEKKKGFFSTVLGFLGSAGSFIGGLFGGKNSGGSKLGIIGSLLKGWGIASAIIGIINAFNPGFSDDLANRADNISQNVPNIIEQYVTPFVGKVFDTIGKGISGAIDFAGKNASTIYNNILKPMGESLTNLVTEYGPAFIDKSVDVMVSLIPSMTDAFVRVVPKLVTSLTTSIWSSTAGKFFGNQSDTKKISEDDIAFTIFDDNGNPVAYQTEDGSYATVNPATGEWEVTGKRTGIGPEGERYTVANSGAREAVGKTIAKSTLDMMAHGSGSLGGKVIRGAGKAVGGTLGGIAGAAGNIFHIPGLSMIGGAKIGSKAGGGLTNLFTRFFETIGDKGIEQAAKTASEQVTESVVKEATEIGFAHAAEKTGKEVLSNATEAIVKTSAEEAGNAVVVAGKAAAEKAAKVGADTVTDAMLEGAANLSKNGKAASLIAKLADGFTGSKGLVGKLANWLSNIVQKIASKLKSMKKGLGSIIDKAAGKLGLGAAKAVPIITAVMIGFDGITGAMEANNLFHTSNPDGCMRVVSAIMKMLLGLGIVGPVLDCLFEIGGSLLGTDIKCEMATFIYTILMGEEKGKILKMSQEQQAIEAEVYNSIMGTNLSEDAYNDLKNKTFWQNTGDFWASLVSPTRRAQLEAEKKAIEEAQFQAAKAVRDGNVSLGSSTTSTTSGFNSSGQSPRGGGRYTATQSDGEMDAGYSYGLGYGRYSQGDSRWNKMRIGTLPNGKAATMGNAGCGPTALAMAANDLGRGKINPASVGAFAARNGYISGGGANAGLFTEGAARMGMTSTPIHTRGDMAAQIASGNPVILSGRSSSGNDPYTKAGHIVVAEGMDSTGRVKVKDPLDGASKRYKFGDLARSTRVGFALGRGRSLGYGKRVDFLQKLLGYGNIEDYTISDSDFDMIFIGDVSESSDLKRRRDDPYGGLIGMQYVGRAGTTAAQQAGEAIRKNKRSKAQAKFEELSINQVLGFAIRALRRGADFHDPIISVIDGTENNTDESRVSINRSEVIDRLKLISNGGAINGVTPDSDQKSAASILATALQYTYIEGADSIGKYSIKEFVTALLFNTGTHAYQLYKAWKNGWLPISVTSMKLWADTMLNDNYLSSPGVARVASGTKDTLSMREFINKFKTVINGMNAAQQYYNIISQLEKVYKVRLEIETTGKDAATIEKEIEKKDRAATMSSIYNEIVADLAMHKISDYSTYNINGYTAYDAHDAEWSNLQYWDKPFGENDETMQSPVMAMSSILTTMTGKPFTPKLMIEKVLPYIGHKMRDGAGTMPYVGTSQTTGGYKERFNFVPRNADQAKNFFGMDFITDAAGNALKVTPFSFVNANSGKINEIKRGLENGIPFVLPGVRFNGSIFGGTGDAPSNRSKLTDMPWGILQSYIPGLDRIHYLMTGDTRGLYSAGANIFERYPKEHFYSDGYQFQYADGSVPAFNLTGGQYGILADGIEPPEVAEEETGPWAILSRLMKAIYKGASGVVETLLNGGGLSDAYTNAAQNMGAVLGGNNTTRATSTSVNGTPSAQSMGITDGVTSAENEKQIYKFFKAKGLSDIEIAAIMANFKEESGYMPNNLQNSYNNSLGVDDATYTAMIDSGKYTKNDFSGSGHRHGGYGLAQWTYYTRKQGLYDLAKAQNSSIGSLGTQLDWAWQELQPYLGGLSRQTDLAGATNYIMKEYEKPANQDPSIRIASAQDIYNRRATLGAGLGYGPGFDGFASDANVIAQTMGGLLYSKLTGGNWRDGMNAVGNVSAGISSDIFGNPVNGTYALDGAVGSTAPVGDLVNYNPGPASAKQVELVNKMRSIMGTLKYSLASGQQDPDRGSASCASTVGWAYRKVMGVNGMSAGAGYQAADNRFKTIYQKRSSGQRPDLSKLQAGDIIYEDWRSPYVNDGPFDSTLLTDASGTKYYHMSHAEMYTGDGRVLSHGGPETSNPSGMGPIVKQLNADRQKGVMLVRRHESFVNNTSTTPSARSVVMMDNPPTDITEVLRNRSQREMIDLMRRGLVDPIGMGLGYGEPDIDAAFNAIQLNRDQIHDKLDTGWKAAQTTTPKIEYHETIGYGPGATEVARALRNDRSGEILGAILTVIDEWHSESKKKPSGDNLTFNTTTNTVVRGSDGQVVEKHVQPPPIEQQKMDNSRLQELHRQIATIKRK